MLHYFKRIRDGVEALPRNWVECEISPRKYRQREALYHRWSPSLLRETPCSGKPIAPVLFNINRQKKRDCSKDTGFIQPMHDGVRRGCVDDLRRGLHATYPRPSGHGSALATAPGRH